MNAKQPLALRIAKLESAKVADVLGRVFILPAGELQTFRAPAGLAACILLPSNGREMHP